MDLEPLTTSDTPLAAFLRYHKHQHIGFKQDPNDVKRRVYVFVRLHESEELINEFYQGEPQVDPRYFFKCASEMIKKLNEDKWRQNNG